MTKPAGILLAAGVTVAGLLTAAPAPAAAGTGAPPAPVARAARLAWTDCPTESHPKLQCAKVRAPLDHDRPSGRTVTLALSRIPHTAKTFQGPLLVNPGGPGGSGLSMAGFVASSLPKKLAAQYDVIGFDPRGVGRSTPALNCVPGHFAPVRPDSVPASWHRERHDRDRAEGFARACGEKYGDLLPYIDTVSAAKDLDVIRRALGARQVSYLGYSYGTYLGAVYAKLYPERVRRLVLDSVVDPDAVWYDANLSQDRAFDRRHKAFAAWVAEHDAAYGLGTDAARVEAAWYRMRADVVRRPAGGKVGGGELEDTFLPGGYYNGYWPYLAEAFAAYAKDGDADALVEAYETFAAPSPAGENGYSVYTAVQCRDAAWPRLWSTWRNDTRRIHAEAPFMTWNNTWYNAPCADWPVEPLTPLPVANDRLPATLLLQATGDAATPYEGALGMHRALAGSSLVVERGGANHGVSLSGNACLDKHLTAYLTDGSVPRGRGEADAVCRALPDPKPLPAEKAAAQSVRNSGGSRLHSLLGFRR
ncbi:alpha/beta hydrolase [Streptomyces sp. NPDC088729]|uniref:alpha/beta hydrolase n=1 Tax=Streptomyces sp. NPDC088729 TaxID=3365876 RepID=UPI0038074281